MSRWKLWFVLFLAGVCFKATAGITVESVEAFQYGWRVRVAVKGFAPPLSPIANFNGFVLKRDGKPLGIAKTEIHKGKEIILTPAAADRLVRGATYTLSYAQGTLRDASGAALTSFDDRPVNMEAVPAMDQQGWTLIARSRDTQVIYVDSSRPDDAGHGRSPQEAKKTIAAGAALIRNGSSDHLLLRRGGVWRESLTLGAAKTHGRSPAAPIVVAAYGDGPRPLLLTGNNNGFLMGRGNNSFAGNLHVIDLDYYAHTRDPQNAEYNPSHSLSGNQGISWNRHGGHILFEGCRIRFYGANNAAVDPGEAGLKDLMFRRCQFDHCYRADGAHSSGLWTNYCEGVLVEECNFDHNGWNATLGSPRTTQNHNLYFSASNTVLRVIGTISSRGASHGAQMRPGGDVIESLFSRNAIAFFTASNKGYATARDASLIHDNVVLEADDISPSVRRGWGIHIPQITYADVRRNVVAHKLSRENSTAIEVSPSPDASDEVPWQVELNDNIVYDWKHPGGAFRVHSNPPHADGAKVLSRKGNQVEGKDERTGMERRYSDPGRTVETYHRSLGGAGDYNAFMEAALTMDRRNWDARLTARGVVDYVRGGFDMAPVQTVGK